MSFLALAVFAGMSANLVLQMGLGMGEIALAEDGPRRGNAAGLLARFLVFLVSVLAPWAVFRLLPLGFAGYLLAFPAALLASDGCRLLLGRFLPGLAPASGADGEPGSSYAAGATLFMTLALAGNFAEALVLALAFAAGMSFAFAAVAGIRRRARMHAVPRGLAGAPLALVSMGLLSLVLSAAAAMFLALTVGR